jgi:hypothetical protein
MNATVVDCDEWGGDKEPQVRGCRQLNHELDSLSSTCLRLEDTSVNTVWKVA